MTTAPALVCRDLVAGYDGVRVLDGLRLEVERGETVALLGPSGSGKTTLLYAIAGLIKPESGVIELGGQRIGPEVAPEARAIGMVFQNYALWPHLSAVDTVAYPMRRRGMGAAEAEREANRLLELVGIPELAARRPDQLSGGQQQRVGVARALAASPQLFLLDEPTAHLDAELRARLQQELGDGELRSGTAALYTTHDAAEAMAVGNRVAVMRRGAITQIGTPADIYSQPADPWTAGVTGAASVLLGDLHSAGGDRLELSLGAATIRTAGGAAVEPGPAAIIVRPDWVTLGGKLSGVVLQVRYEGPHTDYTILTEAGELQVRHPGTPELSVGGAASWSLDRAWVVAAEPPPAISP